jgi:hypothetical protein
MDEGKVPKTYMMTGIFRGYFEEADIDNNFKNYQSAPQNDDERELKELYDERKKNDYIDWIPVTNQYS